MNRIEGHLTQQEMDYFEQNLAARVERVDFDYDTNQLISLQFEEGLLVPAGFLRRFVRFMMRRT